MKIGALSVARITPIALLDAAKRVEEVEASAVAARDPGRAQAFADEYGIPTVHRNYAELVADRSLDAVYIALPASLHAEWSIAALRAGKHVLCEKPFASNATEARHMVAEANCADRRLVEALHWRFHPLATRLLELADRIGPLVSGEGRFDARIPLIDIRCIRALGGGATMDLGCYAIHWLRTVAAEEPRVVRAKAIEGPVGIDVTMDAELRFPSGFVAVIHCSMDPQSVGPSHSASLVLEGRNGTLRIDNPIAPQNGNRVRCHLEGGEEIDETIDGATSYECQLRSFARVVAGCEEPITGGLDSIANMTVIDAIYTAAGLGQRP